MTLPLMPSFVSLSAISFVNFQITSLMASAAFWRSESGKPLLQKLPPFAICLKYENTEQRLRLIVFGSDPISVLSTYSSNFAKPDLTSCTGSSSSSFLMIDRYDLSLVAKILLSGLSLGNSTPSFACLNISVLPFFCKSA